MTLLTVIKRHKLKQKDIKILTLGLDNSGKTSIVNTILEKPNDELTPTMGFDIQSINKRGYNLNIWDIGGQLTLRNYWFNYFQDKFDVILWVIDITDYRLEQSIHEFQKIKSFLVNVKLLVILNKMDLFNGNLEQFKTNLLQRLELNTSEIHHCIIETSTVASSSKFHNISLIIEELLPDDPNKKKDSFLHIYV